MIVTGSKDSALDAAYVAVVGPDEDAAEADDIKAAWEVGYELAQQGAVLVCGGLKGVMKAACEGVSKSNEEKKTNRQAIGLLPGRDRHEGNAYLSVALPTGLDELRNGLVVSVSDAVIVIGCSWGTLSEIALAMRMSKPTILISKLGWKIQYPHNPPTEKPFFVSSPKKAVKKAMREIAARKANRTDAT
jgi:hypothetical protein